MHGTLPGALLAATLLLAACGDNAGEGGDGAAADAARSSPDTAAPGDAAADDAAPGRPAGGWDLVSSGEGAALVFPTKGETAIRLFCPSGANRFLVNVPGFRPVGSEERMTFGSGGNAHTLVADTRGDPQRGGVSGTGAVPAGLAALIGGPVSVNYGAQDSGPHPAPPADLARAFVTACNDAAPAPTPNRTPAPPSAPGPTNVSACLVQEGERLANPPLRALGTEPFWGARIEGRCVTYSHPENQQGTRVWTRYTPGAGGGGSWTGALGGDLFVLTARPEAGCSDGMSDQRYSFAVELTVGGEQRRGCAERR